MYEKHINDMNKEKEFASEVVLPRLKKTVTYKNESDEKLEFIAQKVAALLKKTMILLLKMRNNWESYVFAI